MERLIQQEPLFDEFLRGQPTGMQAIEVNVKDLVQRMQENRNKHRDQFLEALEGWRVAVIERLEQMLDDAKSNRKVDAWVRLNQPEDHTRDYDRVIGMLDMTVSETILLSEQEFAMYAQDDWGWRGKFLTDNRFYSRSVSKEFAESPYADNQ